MKLANAIVVFAVAILLPISALCQDQRIDQIVSRLRHDWRYSDLSVVTPEIRDEVIRRIRGFTPSTFAETKGARTDYLLLVRLGDADATMQVVEASLPSMVKNDWLALQSHVVNYAHPTVIPSIAKIFFLNDGDTMTYQGGSDNVFYIGPRSVEMCRLALSVILRKDAFSHETRVWAKNNLELVDHNPPRRTREMMQQWWRDNEAHFQARDYQAVRPGQILSYPRGVLVEDIPLSSPPLQTTATPALPISTPQPVAALPIPTFVESSASFVKACWVVVGIVALTGIALLVWKRRARK